MGSTHRAGTLAQTLGQTMASWALLAYVGQWDDASIWVVVPLVAAIAVPFRHDGSERDRALTNFAAAAVLSGVLWWELLSDVLDGLVGDGGASLGAVSTLLLAACVLFTLAGGLFWIRREDTLM